MTVQKKRMIAILSCVLIFGLSFGVSYAFLIEKAYQANHFTVGETVINIKEEYSPPEELLPGVAFPKKPWVVNEGNLPCFVRARVLFTDNKAEELCSLDFDPSGDWVKDADGYYYYTELLYPGQSTKPIFTTVTIKITDQDGAAIEKADMMDFEISVYAESVHHTSHQGQHPAEEYKDAFTAY